MAWIVDTCVLLDVRLDDPNFGRASAACLVANRPTADVLIAAFALRHQGLIARNTADFRSICPALTLIEP